MEKLSNENMGDVTQEGDFSVRIKPGYSHYWNFQQLHVAVGDQGDWAR